MKEEVLVGNILFIDYAMLGFSRYADRLAKELKSRGVNGKLLWMYMEKNKSAAPEGTAFDGIYSARSFKYDPARIISELEPSAIVVFAHRFFDYMFTVEAHKHGIPVFNFQHGIYMDSTVISSLSKGTTGQLLKKKKDQLLLYSRCTYHLNNRKITKTLSTFMELRKHDLYKVMNGRFGNTCNADVSFIYGEYWKEFYSRHYLETATDFKVIGYPELEGELKDTSDCFNNDLPVACYLAQTSVEDGIIDESFLQDFFSVLESRLGNINLILKLHPRSDIKLYKKLLDKTGSVKLWDSPEFPKCDLYIGHESTVVARALDITNKTMVYRLSEDRKSPFEQYTKYVCTNRDSFAEQLNSMLSDNEGMGVSSDFSSYVYKNPNGALKDTARIIAETL